MAYVTPSTALTGDLIAAADWNKNTVDNPIALRTGAIAIASQAANDVIYASSATQLARRAPRSSVPVALPPAAPSVRQQALIVFGTRASRELSLAPRMHDVV